MIHGLPLGVKGLKVATTLQDSRFASGIEGIKS